MIHRGGREDRIRGGGWDPRETRQPTRMASIQTDIIPYKTPSPVRIGEPHNVRHLNHVQVDCKEASGFTGLPIGWGRCLASLATKSSSADVPCDNESPR